MPIFRTNGQNVFFAHVPKCAGTSVEDYLSERFGPLSFLNRQHKLGERRNWSASSPQHILARDLEALFDRSHFDAGFAVVRDPLERFISAFRYHRDHGKRISAAMTPGQWIEKIRAFDLFEHRAFDNHFFPQSAFVPDWCTAFRLEDGLGQVTDWLDEIAGASVAFDIPETFKGGYAAAYHDEDFVAPVEGFYREDYTRFGYRRTSTILPSRAASIGIFDAADLSAVDASEDALSRIGTVGVFLHVFYEDMLEGIMQEIRRLPLPTRVYISTTTRNDRANIERIAPEAEIRVFENRGRDIWPKVWGFADRYSRHMVVLHIHTKKSLHDKRLKQWSGHIFSSLLDPERARQIAGTFASNPKVGMIAPAIPEVTQPYCTWRKNYKAAGKIAARLGITIEDDGRQFAFPAGSMFWARSEIVARLAGLDLPQSHFPDEKGQRDGTPAHAVERLFGILTRAMGLDLIYVKATEP